MIRSICAVSSLILVAAAMLPACSVEIGEPGPDSTPSTEASEAAESAEAPEEDVAEVEQALGGCATLYKDVNFGGAPRDVANNEFAAWIGDPWNDKVSSLKVSIGCLFTGWAHANYSGQTYTRLNAYGNGQGQVSWIGDGWNDRISSYTCTCYY